MIKAVRTLTIMLNITELSTKQTELYKLKRRGISKRVITGMKEKNALSKDKGGSRGTNINLIQVYLNYFE